MSLFSAHWLLKGKLAKVTKETLPLYYGDSGVSNKTVKQRMGEFKRDRLIQKSTI